MYDEKSETFGTARLEKGETENAIKKSSKDNYCEKLKTNKNCPISSAADFASHLSDYFFVTILKS